ncbi:RNA polymerase sigma factor SigZ [Thalassotalea agarivorans]|uniref:RNA polymerase sigma factor SigZ n=1 Tax=Thalassotalea agarivorans TaxID=349064 RepID=A0A1H9ZLY2_THASX|nr:RNA polymerase sigma factor SigZ [Thalassotalea agarivorans]SES82646.1 RNA polymerase sigma-70 factor, ECF subfamily [Thalassotalea agarivorans]
MQLEQIWSTYRGTLKNFLHAKVSDPDEVEDLLQDVLIKVHTNLDKIKDDSSVKSWLFTTTNHAIIDFYRSNARKRQLTQEDTWYEEEAEEDIKQQMAPCVLSFIDGLDADDAALLRMVEIENKPQKALAESMNISYSTLKSRVQSARRKLKGLFDQCCSFELDSQGNLMDATRKNNACSKC